MSHTTRLRATALAGASALLLLTGCGSASSSAGNDATDATFGWIPQEDEATGVDFSLPVPITGPTEQRRPGAGTAVASRAYAGQAGELTLSVRFLSTPDSPESLVEEVPAQRMPYRVIDQIRAEGDYQVDVISNQRVDGTEQPTYDARLRASSEEEDAAWAMRTRAFDEFVLVTQVVGFPEGEVSPAFEQQVQTAFERLNATVEIPASVR